MTVNSDEKIIAMEWTYKNDEGFCGQTHQMLKPYGDVPLADIDQDAAIKMLEMQLTITIDQLDQAIHSQEQRRTSEKECQEYRIDLQGSFAKVRKDEESLDEIITESLLGYTQTIIIYTEEPAV